MTQYEMSGLEALDEPNGNRGLTRPLSRWAGVTRVVRGRGLPAAVIGEPAIVRWLLIGVALLFLALVLLVPIAAVFAQALEKGPAAYASALSQPSLRFAVQLTLLTAVVTVPL